MARSATQFGGLRAITAVVALYALALQAFLGGLAPMAAMGGADPLCVSGSAFGAGPSDPDKAPAHHDHNACCVAPCMATSAAAPAPLTTGVAWPPRSAARIAWAPDIRVAARAPPRSIAHPRGPPSV